MKKKGKSKSVMSSSGVLFARTRYQVFSFECMNQVVSDGFKDTSFNATDALRCEELTGRVQWAEASPALAREEAAQRWG